MEDATQSSKLIEYCQLIGSDTIGKEFAIENLV